MLQWGKSPLQECKMIVVVIFSILLLLQLCSQLCVRIRASNMALQTAQVCEPENLWDENLLLHYCDLIIAFQTRKMLAFFVLRAEDFTVSY